MKKIIELPDIVKDLSDEEREVFKRFFEVYKSKGRLELPKTMLSWVEDNFESRDKVEEQKIIKVYNKLLFEGSLFNGVRTERPLDIEKNKNIKERIDSSRGGPFCKPKKMTPKCEFGRVEGEESITGANVAKYDSVHGLNIFKDHNPFSFTFEKIDDYLKTGMKWVREAYENRKEDGFKYPHIMWNCMPKAGASIIHGHMQLLLTQGRHYANIDLYRQASVKYSENYSSNFFEDWFQAHSSVGLGAKFGNVKLFANLTPRKEKEIIITSKDFKTPVSKVIHSVLSSLVKHMGVESFNVGIMLPPLDKSWKSFPGCVIRIIDRGSLNSPTVDYGGLEITAGHVVIGTDPYKAIGVVKRGLEKTKKNENNSKI